MPDVVAAINARAQLISVRHYEKIKEQLKNVALHHADGMSGEALVHLVMNIDLPDHGITQVHRDVLLRITSGIASLFKDQEKVMAAIDQLEARTGLAWYSRNPERSLCE